MPMVVGWVSVSATVLALGVVSITVVYGKYFTTPALGSRPFSAWIIHLAQSKPIDIAARWIWAEAKAGSKIVSSLQSGAWGRIVASHSAATLILGNNKKFPKKSTHDSLLGTLLGTNLLYSNGDTWRRHRQILAPPFRKIPSIHHISPIVHDAFTTIDTEFSGRPVDIFRLMQHLSFDFFAKALLGVEMHTVRDRNPGVLDSFNTLVMVALDPLYLALPWFRKLRNPFGNSCASHLASLNQFVENMIKGKARQSHEGSGNTTQRNDEDCDVLSLMFKASRDTEIGFTKTEMRDNITQLLIPTITTASTLTHVLHHLARNHSVQKKLRAEVRAHSLGAPIPTADQIGQMTYLAAVVKETMRLSPAFAQLPARVATKWCQIDGVDFPPGTDIIIDLFTMQRDPDYYQDPLKFDPERFATGDERTPWLSFGGGMRTCVGLRVALMEIKAVVAMMVSRYSVAYPPEFTPCLDPALAACPLLMPLDVHLVLTPIADYHT